MARAKPLTRVRGRFDQLGYLFLSRSVTFYFRETFRKSRRSSARLLVGGRAGDDWRFRWLTLAGDFSLGFLSNARRTRRVHVAARRQEQTARNDSGRDEEEEEEER